MINKISVRENQLATFVPLKLTKSEKDFLLFHFPISYLNELIELENKVTEILGHETLDYKILETLVKKVHIFEK